MDFSMFFSSICLKSFHIKKLGINIFVLEIFLVDLHLGVSLLLNSHICIHRDHLPGSMSELSFPLPHEQYLAVQWAPCTNLIFMTFFDLKAHTKLNTLYPLQQLPSASLMLSFVLDFGCSIV